jgi:hypothetical protein
MMPPEAIVSTKRQRVTCDSIDEKRASSIATDVSFKPRIVRLPSALRFCCYQYLELEALVDLYAVQRDVRVSIQTYLKTATVILVSTRNNIVGGLCLLQRCARVLRQLIIGQNVVLPMDVAMVARLMCVNILAHNGATLHYIYLGQLYAADTWQAIATYCTQLKNYGPRKPTSFLVRVSGILHAKLHASVQSQSTIYTWNANLACVPKRSLTFSNSVIVFLRGEWCARRGGWDGGGRRGDDEMEIPMRHIYKLDANICSHCERV